MRLEQCAERTRSLRPRVPLRRDAARADYSIYSSSSCTAHDTSGFVFACRGGVNPVAPRHGPSAGSVTCRTSSVEEQCASYMSHDRHWAVCRDECEYMYCRVASIPERRDL